MNFGKMPLRLFITILEAIIARKVFSSTSILWHSIFVDIRSYLDYHCHIYIFVVYTIIIFTYKYLEQCFTSITYYSSYSSSCNFVTISNKISPTILGFTHMLEDPYKYISTKALTKWSTWCKVPCPGQIHTSLNSTQGTIITSYAQETHTPFFFFLIIKWFDTIGNLHDTKYLCVEKIQYITLYNNHWCKKLKLYLIKN